MFRNLDQDDRRKPAFVFCFIFIRKGSYQAVKSNNMVRGWTFQIMKHKEYVQYTV